MRDVAYVDGITVLQVATEAAGLSPLEQWGIIAAILFGVIGTGLGVANSVIAWRDRRPSVRVTSSFAIIPNYSERWFLAIEAANTGMCEVTLSSLSLRAPDGFGDKVTAKLAVIPETVYSTQLPFPLEAGKKATFFLYPDNLARILAAGGESGVMRLRPELDDQTGQTWRSSRRKAIKFNVEHWLGSREDVN